MSYDPDYEPKLPELTKLRKFEMKFDIPFDFYISFGSTFYLVPDLTWNEHEKAFDWLWFHIGLIKI